MKKIILSVLAGALLVTASYFTYSYGRRYYRRGWRHRRDYGGNIALGVGAGLLTSAVVASQLSKNDDVSGREALRAVGRLGDVVQDLKDRVTRIEDDIREINRTLK